MKEPMQVNAINVHELKRLKDEKKDFQLVDVREENEHEFCNIGGTLIPAGTVLANIDAFSKEKQVIVYCRSGVRSAQVILALQQRFGFTNLYNLEGGILAWSDEIDPSVPKY